MPLFKIVQVLAIMRANILLGLGLGWVVSALRPNGKRNQYPVQERERVKRKIIYVFLFEHFCTHQRKFYKELEFFLLGSKQRYEDIW